MHSVNFIVGQSNVGHKYGYMRICIQVPGSNGTQFHPRFSMGLTHTFADLDQHRYERIYGGLYTYMEVSTHSCILI